MAVIVSTNAFCSVNTCNLSDHAAKITVNDGQETRDVTAHGASYRQHRAGLGTPRITINFWNDHATGEVESVLRALIGVNTTGVDIYCRKVNGARGASNPEYHMIGIIDGDLLVLDDEVGEVPQLQADFIPYSTWEILTAGT